MKHSSVFFLAVLLPSSPVVAADVATSTASGTIGHVATPWTIGIEVAPEIFAIDEDPHDDVPGKQSTKPAGALSDYYGKISVDYRFDNDWIVGAYFQNEVKQVRNNSGEVTDNTNQYYAEGSVGYAFAWGDVRLKPSVGIGYTWGSTGIYGDVNSSRDNDVWFYTLNLAGDWKLDAQWTWNVFNLRYRDAFQYTWVTPKVATGITYRVNPVDAVYTEVGFAWKELDASGQASSPPFNPNYGSLDSDKWTIALGYKHGF
jgi:hypothetical protein